MDDACSLYAGDLVSLRSSELASYISGLCFGLRADAPF